MFSVGQTVVYHDKNGYGDPNLNGKKGTVFSVDEIGQRAGVRFAIGADRSACYWENLCLDKPLTDLETNILEYILYEKKELGLS